MSVTLQDIIDRVNIHIGDSGTDSVSASERITAIDTATKWLLDEVGGFDMQSLTFDQSYFDTVHHYNITSNVSEMGEPVDLRRLDPFQDQAATHKSYREFSSMVNIGFSEFAFAIERRNEQTWLGINLQGRFSAKQLHDCDSATSNGTWRVGETSSANSSDATNLTADTAEFQQGSGSINFDIDVSQAGGNLATISNEDMSAVDLSDENDLGSLLAWVYLPTVTNFSSITAYWGDTTTTYWSATVTTDIDGAAWVAGWNQIAVAWSDATATGSPNAAAIDYLRFDYNYTASQGDDTDYRLDRVRMVRPETLRLYYHSWRVGENSGGTTLLEFTAATDVPFFSGLYDHFIVPIAHKAAAYIMEGITQELVEADRQHKHAEAELRRLNDKFPSSVLRKTKHFKVRGLGWKGTRGRRG